MGSGDSGGDTNRNKKIASKQEVEASKVRAEVGVDENQMSAYQLAQIKKNQW